MDLASFVPGVLRTANFTPGAETPSPFNVTHTGVTDGTSPATASIMMAEFMNRLNLQIASAVVQYGFAYTPANWAQLGDVIAALKNDISNATPTPVDLSGYAQYATQGLWLEAQRPFYTNDLGVAGGDSLTYDGAINGQISVINCAGSGDITFNAPSGIIEGAMYKWLLAPTDAAARTFSWDTAFKFPNGTPPLTEGSTAVGGYDIITFLGGPGNTMIYDGSIANVY